MGQHGGKRKGAGRKSKAEEQSLVEKLSPMDDEALNALKSALKAKQPWAVKLFMQYMYGMPKQTNENFNNHNFEGGIDLKDLFSDKS